MCDTFSYKITAGEIDGVTLYAPEEFWKLTDEDRKAFGGCGPGKIGDKFIPDSLWFLNIKVCCLIHDYMYFVGKTPQDRWFADVSFLSNMNSYIEVKSNFANRMFRRYWAMTYFAAVREFGEKSFEDKTK